MIVVVSFLVSFSLPFFFFTVTVSMITPFSGLFSASPLAN